MRCIEHRIRCRAFRLRACFECLGTRQAEDIRRKSDFSNTLSALSTRIFSFQTKTPPSRKSGTRAQDSRGTTLVEAAPDEAASAWSPIFRWAGAQVRENQSEGPSSKGTAPAYLKRSTAVHPPKLNSAAAACPGFQPETPALCRRESPRMVFGFACATHYRAACLSVSRRVFGRVDPI
jgi:hypothetical protein